jgi:uncharacterized RDD family membrane protein YckC
MAMNPYAAPNADLLAGVAGAQQELAGRGARFGATLLDNLVLCVVPGIAVAATASKEGPSVVGMAIAGLWFIAVLIYQAILLGSRGQTLAKKWLGIKLVTLDGGPVTFGSAVIMRVIVGQVLLGIVPFYFLIDPLFIFREDRRCVHDLVAGTKVVVA